MPPLFVRQCIHEIQLDTLGIAPLRQPQTLRDPQNVGVDGDAFVLMETGPENDRRGFPPDTRERRQLLHRPRHLASVLLQQDMAEFLDVLRFRPVEAAGADIGLERGAAHANVILRFPILGIQDRLGHKIHPNVGALRGEHRRDEQIQRRAECQKRPRGLVALAQRAEGGRCRQFLGRHVNSIPPSEVRFPIPDSLLYTLPVPLPPLTVFDVETTGLDPRRGHRIIEIAGVRVENGIVTERTFHSLVNPERDIPWETKQIHHLSEADVAEAPTIMTVLPQFLDFAGGSILTAHNAEFDMGFLAVEKEFCWGYVELPECLCTMKLSQALFADAFRHNLDAVAERLKLPLPADRHRALPDVILTAQAMIAMLKHGKISSLDELRAKAGLRALTAT
ncbi:MAG: DNA polymerase III domain [Candidatus Peregrinibacteria bacterium Gr01-1014_25]|nr:MAG: DNA polymerase III domain [Candidatus Peregrinibacteria bacterium Gr01-1014_25]